MRKTIAVLLSMLITCSGAFGQAWSGVLDPSRAVDWKNVGYASGSYGNVPHNTTICSTLGTSGQLSTFAQSTTAVQISSAIQSCGLNQVVLLNPGTYTMSSAIDFGGHSNVTLRGSGPLQTIVKFTSGSGCVYGQTTDVCMEASGPLNFSGNPNNLTTWTAGYSVGTTVVTLGSVTGLSVGQLLILDQKNDTVDTNQVFVCNNNDGNATINPPGFPNGSLNNNPNATLVGCDNSANGVTGSGRVVGTDTFSQQHYGIVTNINGLNVTIDTPLYHSNWRSGQSPGAWWSNNLIHDVGVENLTFDHTNSTGEVFGIMMDNCYKCWVRNIRGLFANRANVHCQNSFRLVVRDSYFYGTQNAASQSYADEFFECANVLDINNIFQHVSSPLLHNSDSYVVEAYNYDIDNFHGSANASFNFAGAHWNHAAGTDFILTEYEQGIQCLEDAIHGSHNMNTFFRNFYIGPDIAGPATSETAACVLMSHSRYENFVGNVLGKAGYHNTYQVVAGGSTTNCDTAIWNIGWPNTSCQGDGTSPPAVPNDSLVSSTSYRFGNFDVISNAVRWCASNDPNFANPPCSSVSEVPTGLSQFAQPNPSGHTLPTSFFLVDSNGTPYARPPTWWKTPYGNVPWPAVGPDVIGGTVISGTGTGSGLGGHVYLIPAALCQQNTSLDTTNYPSTNIIAFDAAVCYPNENTTTPDAQTPSAVVPAPASWIFARRINAYSWPEWTARPTSSHFYYSATGE